VREHVEQTKRAQEAIIKIADELDPKANSGARRDFENLMALADRNKAPETFIGALVRGMQHRVDQRMRERMRQEHFKIDEKCLPTEYEAWRYMMQPRDLNPPITMREFWGLPETGPQPSKTVWDEFNERILRQRDQKENHGSY
jgi:hypothetical protein